jgi:hypothetical protein
MGNKPPFPPGAKIPPGDDWRWYNNKYCKKAYLFLGIHFLAKNGPYLPPQRAEPVTADSVNKES